MISRTADCALSNDLPIVVVDAVLVFIQGPLAQHPRRVGKPLRNELHGQWSARRGSYRVPYVIDEEAQLVKILDIGHRADVYRRP